jgi:CRISPR-associated protein Cas1
MLYSITEQALFAAGLDPHLGILHADEYDRPTLAYDLIEPFRPWVDRFLLLQIFAEKIPPNLVAQRDGGYWVTHDAKKTLIPAFNAYLEKRNRWEGRRIDSRAQIFRHAAALAKLIRLTVKRPR